MYSSSAQVEIFINPASIGHKLYKWQGSLPVAPSSPLENWSYYNITDGNAYIYSNGIWQLLIEKVSDNYDQPTIIGTVAKTDYYDISSVYIKVVDNTNNSTVWNDKPAVDGNFVISGLDESHGYTFYFSSEKQSDVNISYRALAPDNTSTTFGAIRVDVSPLAGKAKNVGEVTLTPNGTVMGKVTLTGLSDYGDIDVYLSGTSFATKTNSSGNFVISDIPQGSYTAYFVKDGFSTESKNVIVFNSDSSVKPVITLPSFALNNLRGKISGQVSVNDSGSVENIEVKAINKDEEHTYTVLTDSNGRYSIEDAYYGDYTISFTKVGYDAFTKSDLTVEKGSSRTVSPMLLSQYGGLKVSINYGDKSDHTGIVLNVYKNGSLVYSTTTSSTGIVIISNLKVGPGYSIVAIADGYCSSGETDVSIESGKVSLVSLNKLSNKYGSVNGIVRDTYGDPISAATVLLKSDSGSSYTLTTSDTGSYSKNDVLTDEYQVTISKEGYSSETLAAKYVVEAAKTITIPDVTLTSIYGVINGIVSYSDGKTSEGILISLENSSGVLVNTANTNSTGAFAFSVIPGTYLVRANATGYDEVSQTLAVVAGKSYSLNLDPLKSVFGTLRVSVSYNNKADSTGIIVSITRNGEFIKNTTVTSNNTVVITGLSAGDGYTVSATADGYSSSSVSNVTIKKNAETSLKLEKLSYSFGSVSGKIIDSNGLALKGAIVNLISDNNSYTIPTGEDGTFVKDDIATGTYAVTVTLQDYVTATINERVSIQSAKETKLGITVLTKQNGTIDGTVKCSGKLNPDISVSLIDAEGKTVNTVVASSTGSFTFTNVKAGTYTLSATADGCSTSVKTIAVADGEKYSITMDSIVYQYGTITGKVVDSTGNPLVGAIVLFTPESGEATTTSTNNDGTFPLSLRNGKYTVTISKAGYVSQFFNNVVISSGSSYPLDTITMTIGTAGISGRVVLSGETNHSGVTVTITDTKDSSRMYSTTTDDTGVYSFTAIEVGEYIVKIQKTGFVTNQSIMLSPVAGIIVEAPVVTLQNNNSTVTGTIILDGTSNYAGVNILLTSADSSVTYNSTTLQSGKFTVTNVKPGTYTMTITKPGYESQTIENVFVEASSTKTIDSLNLSIAFASITGKVKLELKSDYAGALITATNINNTNLIYSAITNSAGEYSFAEMYTGEYRLVITADNYVTTTLPTINVIDSKTVDAGITSLAIARGKISGLVKLEGYSDYSGIKVSLLGTEYTTVTASDGSYSFNVPAGNYPGGIRYEYDDFETSSHASTVPVLTNSTYAIPDKTLKCVNVPKISGKVSIFGSTDGHYENITIRIAELPKFTYTTINDGTWFFEHVPVGTYTLEIERENARKVTKIIAVKASPSITIEDIELIPDSVTLTGNIALDSVSDYSGVTVRVTTPGSVELKTVTNAAGYFYISNIVASKSHTMYFEKEGWDTVSFEIAANKYEPLAEVNFTNEHSVTLYDTTKPELTGLTATIGRSTEKGREVYLYLYGSDKGSGIKYIQGNTSNAFDSVLKQEYYNPFTLYVPDEIGAKTLYVRVFDASGNVSVVVSTNIVITNDKTELNGPLSGDKLHLTKENSPYLMTNHVLVEKGSTLVIDPGVEIQVKGNYFIQVEGKLEAKGTESERIKIYGIDDGAKNWDGIKILTKDSTLSYIDITGLKNGIYSYLSCDIDHALISSNDWAVKNNESKIDKNNGSLTDSIISGSVSVRNGKVNRNNIQGETINIYETSVYDNTINGNTTIKSSNIDGNVFSGSKLTTSYSFVYNNIVSTTDVGSIGDIQRFVTYNGCRIALESGFSDIQFNNCTFSTFNGYVNNSNIINCGDIDVTTNNASEYFYDATGNYWGDKNTVEIKSKGENQNLSFIIDRYDNVFFRGPRVDYSGYKENAIADVGYEAGRGRVEGTTALYKIGDIGPAGGLIFYDKGFYSDGWRYLEAAPSDIGQFVFGYYRPNGVNNNRVGTAEVIGAGRYNIERLVKYMNLESDKAYSKDSGNETADYAARKCFDYSYGGRDDWFLPSNDELNLMYLNLHKKGLGSFDDNWYWSSSEGYLDTAIKQDFSSGNKKSPSRAYDSYVRPARAF